MEDCQFWKEQKKKPFMEIWTTAGKQDCYSQEMLRKGLKRLFRNVQPKLLLLDILKWE